MSKQAKAADLANTRTPALVPKIRFPEFRNAGEWQPKSLGDIGEIITGKTPSTADLSLWNGDVMFVTPTDMSEQKYQLKTQRTVVGEGSVKVLPAHSIMFTCIASIGKMAMSVYPSITNQQINSLIPKKDYLNDYIYYSLLNIVPAIKATQANSTLPIINKTEFSKFIVAVPVDIKEQQKIADCLSSLDELMMAQASKVAALKAHKKGLMQQLFPAEGQTIPVLRFPEFRNAPGWENKLLGQVVESVTTGKLDANAMVENGRYRFYTCAKNYYYIDDYAFDTEALLVAGNGAYLGYIHYYKGKFNAYQRTYVLSGFGANVTYLKFYLDKNLPDRIRAEKKDGNTPYIVMSTLTDMPLLLPDISEQQKIADCLSSLDELIAAQDSKVEALKAHKKGLMQQLFPTIHEDAA